MQTRGTVRHRSVQPVPALRTPSPVGGSARRSACEPTTTDRLAGYSANEDAGSPVIDASAAGGGAAGRSGFAESQIRKLHDPAIAVPGEPYGGRGESPAERPAGSLRYAAGGTLVFSSINGWLSDGRLSAEDARGIAVDTGISATAATAGDALSARLGNLRGGAVVDSVVSVVTSVSTNNEAVTAGRVSAGDATANVVIDTAVGVSAGAAGLTIGALAGSAVPGVGTALGAIAGFAVGSLAAWGVATLGGGLLGGLRTALGEALEARFEPPLQVAWSKIDIAKVAVSSTLQSTGGVVKRWFGH